MRAYAISQKSLLFTTHLHGCEKHNSVRSILFLVPNFNYYLFQTAWFYERLKETVEKLYWRNSLSKSMNCDLRETWAMMNNMSDWQKRHDFLHITPLWIWLCIIDYATFYWDQSIKAQEIWRAKFIPKFNILSLSHNSSPAVPSSIQFPEPNFFHATTLILAQPILHVLHNAVWREWID